MKCKDCNYLVFSKSNGSPDRYYCKHPVACNKFGCGAVLVCRCDRHSTILKTKTAPRWCPLKNES